MNGECRVMNSQTSEVGLQTSEVTEDLGGRIGAWQTSEVTEDLGGRIGAWQTSEVTEASEVELILCRLPISYLNLCHQLSFFLNRAVLTTRASVPINKSMRLGCSNVSIPTPFRNKPRAMAM